MFQTRFAAALALTLACGAAQAGPSGYHLAERIPGPDGGWDYAAVNPLHNTVLVGRGAHIMTIDLATKAVNGAFADASGAHAALPINGGTQILVTTGRSDTATIVDGASGALLATIATGKNPDAATFDTATGLVLVMNHSGGDITLIDPLARVAVGSIAVGGKLEAAAVDGAGKAFVNVEDLNEVVAIDLKARKVLAHYKLVACEGPTGIAYAPADNLLITTCDGVADVLNAKTGQSVAMIKTGDGADGVVFDPKSKLAFVSAGESGTLSVISIAKGKARLVDTVPTQTRARTIALDPRDGALYLPTAKSGPPAPNGRPTTLPGSFEVLVVRK
ncbi:MAG: YncE family protein [bacterium]|nr:YncE family protein [bacterium]